MSNAISKSRYINVKWNMEKFFELLKERYIIGWTKNVVSSIYMQMQIYSKVIIEESEVIEDICGEVKCSYGPVTNIVHQNEKQIVYKCSVNPLEMTYMMTAIVEIALEFVINNKYMTNYDMDKYLYLMRGNFCSNT